LQAQPKILKKLQKHQINQSERKLSQKKYVYYHKNVNKLENRIGATRRNLQAQPKILKKIMRISNQPFRTKIVPKKIWLVP
jgi:hypothetical protein